MLVFYYSKDSSALAAHILLEEVCAKYDARLVSIRKEEHLDPNFLSVNPKGRIPALQTPHGVLTENPAILAYIAQTHPEAELLPDAPFAAAQAQAFNAYLASTVHVAFAHWQRGARWADEVTAIEAMRTRVPENMAEAARLIETHYFRGPWVLGDRFSICDPYLFILHRWMGKCGMDIASFPRLAAHVGDMHARPAVQRALEIHRIS